MFPSIYILHPLVLFPLKRYLERHRQQPQQPLARAAPLPKTSLTTTIATFKIAAVYRGQPQQPFTPAAKRVGQGTPATLSFNAL